MQVGKKKDYLPTTLEFQPFILISCLCSTICGVANSTYGLHGTSTPWRHETAHPVDEAKISATDIDREQRKKKRRRNWELQNKPAKYTGAVFSSSEFSQVPWTPKMVNEITCTPASLRLPYDNLKEWSLH